MEKSEQSPEWRNPNRSLILSYKNLSSVPSLVMQVASELTSLDISHNKISVFPHDIFDANFCENIVSLNLGNNLLMTLPLELGKCESLVNLKICNNHLPLLPPTIAKLDTLDRLDASGNRIASVTSALSTLTNLKLLDLSRNMLSHIPDEEIWTLTSLEEISLSSNKLEAIPIGVACLTRLWGLRANNNFISSLEPEIIKLPRLRDLQLSQNNLTHLPGTCWRAATNLTILDVSCNDLDRLPYQLGVLTQLRTLGIARNPRMSPRLAHALFTGGAAAALAHLRSLRPETEYEEEEGVAALHRLEAERRERRRMRLEALVSGTSGEATGANRFYRSLQAMLAEPQSSQEVQEVRERLAKRMLRRRDV